MAKKKVKITKTAAAKIELKESMQLMIENMQRSAKLRREKWWKIAQVYLTPAQIFARPEFAIDDYAKFDMLSLAAWLEVIKQTDVPYIPAETLGQIPQEFFWNMLDQIQTAVDPNYVAALNKLQKLPDNWMVRWDHCTNEDVKAAMHDGAINGWFYSYNTFGDRDGGKPRDLTFYDIRVSELLECYQDPIIIHQRPWIEAKRVLGIDEFSDKLYPAEWRVFVKNGLLEGVSWYYPQSACLEEEYELTSILVALNYYTGLIIDKLGELRLEPHHPHLEEAPPNWRPCFTLDFLQTPDNKLLFLEAGPPHAPNWGAHSCCFLPGNISGVALRKQYRDIHSLK